ncbi:MAG: hypothetical protein IPL99_20065 [Candidatus Competibacteraceae bacterium]|nr:hypothetical protein [Candidatus Competibacteraceae bacterium]
MTEETLDEFAEQTGILETLIKGRLEFGRESKIGKQFDELIHKMHGFRIMRVRDKDKETTQ